LKIGEAVLERDSLDNQLNVLESRLTNDLDQGRPTTHIMEQIEQASSRMLDLQDALDWTMQHLSVRGEPLGAYLNKVDHMERVAALLENTSSPELREKVDSIFIAKKATEIIIQTVYWGFDLQIPDIPVIDPEEEN